MSGTAIEAAGGTIVYIRNNAGTNQYSYNNSTWSTLSFPCTVENTNTGAGFLQVFFTTNITLSTTDSYFETLSDKIQFGSDSVSANGSTPVITIEANSYPGVFQNGTSATSGYNDIRIYNLTVDGTGYSTSLGGGWIGRGYFGNSASGCFIINCSSKGSIGNNAGGILGYYSGTTGGSVSIKGCSSTGSIGEQAGGIVGSNCDNLTCDQCFSEGSIAQNGGGIFGQFTEGNSSATKCYSLGAIALGGGGIIGAGAKDGASAEKCYSQGSIGNSAGGIFGAEAATTTATNCYSLGSLGTSAGGIFGNPFSTPGTRTETNCYKVQGGSWSDATANTNLTGTPTGSPDVGTTWASTSTNTAYELVNFGATPYQAQTISSNALVQSKSQTIEAGQSGSAGLATSTYSILEKTGGDSGSYGTITINVTTGALSTTTATAAGTYTIYVRSIGSYYITTFVLTVTAYVPPAALTERTSTCCKSTMDERDITYEWINEYRIGNRLIAEYSQNPNLKFNGYSEYVKYKMAQAARKT